MAATKNKTILVSCIKVLLLLGGYHSVDWKDALS